MLDVFQIEGVGIGGLNTDLQPWTLQSNAFNRGINFRVINGSIISSGGSRSLSTPPSNNTPGHLLHVNSPTGVFWISMGQSEVLAYNGSNWDTISSWTPGNSPLATGDELLWNGCIIGKVPFINNPQHYPEYWSPQSFGTKLLTLPWDENTGWDAVSVRCRVLRSHKNFLFALNLIEGGAEYPDAYRWSHPADTNGIPFTWNESDSSALAGRAQIGGSSGAIIDGLTLRDSFVIYMQNGIHILDPDPEFVWKRRKLTSTHGLFNRNSLVEVKGKHFFLSDGDIVVNDGTNVKSIMNNRLRVRLTAGASTDYYHRSYAVRNDTLKEIWFCVPEAGAEYPNIAYIYNWADNTWAIRDLPSNLVHASFGPTIISTQTPDKLTNVLATTDNLLWSNWGGNWDEQTRRWSSGAPIPPDPEPPSADFLWSIGNTGDLYGYSGSYGALDPNIVENIFISEITVDNLSKEIILVSNEIIKGSTTITLTLATGEQVVLTWDDITERYMGNDTIFTDIVVLANGTDIGLNITVNDPQVPPPNTPHTASGDTLIGLRRTSANLELMDPSTKDIPLNTLIERTNLAINGQISVSSIVRIYPHIEGTQNVKFTLGSQQFVNDVVNWKTPIIFNPETQRKIDIRTTGPLHAWRIESLDTGSWSFTGFDIEYISNGKR